MAKPTILPVWATDQTNNTEPSAGQKATGWTANQQAVSSYFNWLFYTIYLWLAYLDAGVWDDDLTVTGNLNVNGDTDLDGHLTLGNVTMDGDAAGVLYVNGAILANDIGIQSHVRLPAIVTAASENMAEVAHDPLTVISTGATWWYYSPVIPIREGDRVLHVKVYYSNNATLATISADLGHAKDGSAVDYSSGDTATGAASGSITILVGKTLEVTNGVLDAMFIRIGGQGNNVEINGIEVTYDHPV